ncbi:hypothetical protein BJX61DRAFT_531452 [Aspergillus egyptiacus]|nr:hypothetical protein BJX61DRAFT_531452 [Aspergillus egyptiacus]
MSPMEGNAWAQMKAKEQEQRRSDPGRGKYSSTPTPSTTTTRKFSGLDYDSELALPMPKPRHASPEEIKPNVLSKPNVTKKRSTTDPNLETTKDSSKAEKKKSKVATLRSKFSLKDLGKEFRRDKDRDIPPLSSLPKLGGGSGNELKRASSDGESQVHSPQHFNEAKLYVPKTRVEGDSVHPSSAPPHTSEFRQPSLDKRSQDSALSCPSMITPTKGSGDRSTDGMFKHALVHSTDPQNTPTNAHLETMLLDGSSPAARTGECNNTGHAELVQAQPRVFSIRAENEASTMPSSPHTPPPPPPVDLAEYSPSVYDTPKTVVGKASESSLFEKKEAQKVKQPLIVSSSSYNGRRPEQQMSEDQLFMSPRAAPRPPVLPAKSRAREEQRSSHSNAADESQFFAGVTSHGGFAPPPPHPSYQNTVTLEQQIAAHVDSLHFHLNTASHKLSKTFENNNNWTTDQILRQLENLSDLSRVINSRSVTQADITKELPRMITDLHIQMGLVQREVLHMEERMKALVQQEMARVKNELSEFILATAGGDATQGGSKFVKDGDKRVYQNKRKSRQMPMRPADNKKPAADSNDGSSRPASAQTDATVDKHIDEPSENVPTPTAAFRTPKPQGNPRTDAVTIIPVRRSVVKNQSEESSGSPEKKAATKLRISSPIPVEATQGPSPASTLASSTQQRESDTKPQSAFPSEDAKSPKRKGMFSFRRRDGDNSTNRFLRTPRRAKEGKPSSGHESQSPRLSVSTPTRSSAATTTPTVSSVAATTSSAAGDQIPRGDSPSMIHPALRNPQQKQIMLEREREQRLSQLNRQLQGQGQGQGHTHGHPLRMSHSHQSFGARASRPVSPPNNPSPPHSSFMTFEAPNRYASGISVSSSTSSFHGGPPQQQYFAPPLPPPGVADHPHGHTASPGPGHLRGQMDGVDWCNGNGSLESEVGYPIGNFI